MLKDTWSALSSLNNSLRPFDHTTSLRSAKPECHTSQQQYTSQALTATQPFYSQNEVPVLFQAQPGRFNFSQQFRNRYRETYGTDPDSSHRIGNAAAVEVYCRLGTTASSGDGAYIRLATVPAEAAAAIEILVEADGTEKVTINDHQYALSSYLATLRKDPLWVRNHAWYSMFFNEAKSLSRKIKPYNQQKDLATDSTVPNSNTSPSAQINMLEDHPSPSPKRRCHTVPVAIKSSPVIDPSLPCEICQDPDDWEKMLLCDVCVRGFHTYCIGLTHIPEGDWKCDTCTEKAATNEEVSSQHFQQQPFKSPADSDLSEDDKTEGSEDANTEPEETEEEEANDMEASAKDIWEDYPVLYYIKTKTHNTARLPINSISRRTEIKRIEKRAANYQWDNSSSTLYKKAGGRLHTLLPCPPVGDRHNIITELHSELGHVGGARLTTIINTRYWWPGISKQAKAVVKACPDCIRNRALFRQEVPLQPIPLPDGLFERIHLDSAGPYPKSRSGNKYLYLAVCATSKFPVAMAAPKLSAADFTAFFMHQVVAQHGVPSTVVHDSGPEFGEPWSTCLQELGVEQRRSSAYHPNTNGQAENMVKQILHALQRMINETGSPETWDERLPMALLGLRTAPNASTKHSPAYVVYGRHLCLPAQRRRLAANPATNTNVNAKHSSEDPIQTNIAVTATAADPQAAPAIPAPMLPSNQQPKSVPRPKRQLQLNQQTNKATGNTAGTSFGQDSPITISSAEDLPHDQQLQEPLQEGTKELMRRRRLQQAEVRNQLEQNVRASQEKMKRDHSRRRHSTMPSAVMPPGSLVLMQSPSTSKLSKGIEGPYRLIKYNTGDASEAGTSAAAFTSDSQRPETRALLEDGSAKRWWVSVLRITPFSTHL